MDVRQRTEEIEHLTFAPWATFSDASRGRAVPEPQDPLRPVFQRDRDRVLHCKAFRRLKQKTQVFLSPEGDLYRTRLTHTLEVSQIARTIARALRLNEDLTEAISLAHDLGHTPFGHAGERALNQLCPGGFKHYVQSLRVVDKLEKEGRGLNLSWEDASRGRAVPEPQDPLRPVFQRDRDRVLHCKAFRRLKQKTQVFLSPEGDLYRTRLTHTLEVSQIARTIARALRLNEDLTEAISLAHDLGHTPFGHAGERALNQLCPGGFKHYVQSLRVVDKLEKEGRGLNLSWEVRNGIVTHTKGTWAATPEGRIVRMADQIAYVNHDIEDAVRAGVLDPDILPRDCTAVLGTTKSARITTMINSILRNSDGNVRVGTEENEAFLALRDFMYATVYVDKTAKREEQKVDKVIGELYDYYLNHIDRMSNFYVQLAYQEGRDRAVTDYISGMSDEFAIRTFEELFVPQKWHVL